MTKFWLALAMYFLILFWKADWFLAAFALIVIWLVNEYVNQIAAVIAASAVVRLAPPDLKPPLVPLEGPKNSRIDDSEAFREMLDQYK